MRVSGDDRVETRRAGSNMPWTAEQSHVIEAPVQSRLLIDAGPGTGKTAAACARIAWLLSHGNVDASEVWLFSFTRTAVHELRNRIASFLEDPGDVAALRITTIDSYAWAINSGFDSQASLTGSFDDNIQRVIQLIQRHEGAFAYLSTVRHLIVDEAQDVVGPRCELLLEIINAMPADAGASLFSDEAQAIYGFTEEDGKAALSGTLPEKIREFMSDQFAEHDFRHVHRTEDQTLLDIFRDGRSFIRDKGTSGATRLHSVRALVERTNHGSLGPYWEDIKQLAAAESDTLLLFRRRGEALGASGSMGVVPHRIRMSGLPVCIHGWIAVLLWDWTKPDLDDTEFDRLWNERVGSSRDERASHAWSVLVRAFGRSSSRISVTRLVTKLASSSPTYDLTLPEFGYVGPIISTIHGSKGREASDVRLYLPGLSSGDAADDELEEEARIVFVGATRARETLHVGQSKSMSSARRLESSGRAFTPYPFNKGSKVARATVEVGRVRDVDAAGLVGKHLYGSEGDARDAQARVMALRSGTGPAKGEATTADLDWRFKVVEEDGGGHLCYLGTSLGHDLFAIAKFVDQLVHLGKTRPPRQLNHLRTLGVRTLAVAPDDPVREQLHAPWRDSGLIAAPMLTGYSMAYFR